MEGKLKDSFGIRSMWCKHDAGTANRSTHTIVQELTEEDFPSGPSHATAPVPIHTLHHDTKDVAPCKTLLMSLSSSQDDNDGGNHVADVLPACASVPRRACATRASAAPATSRGSSTLCSCMARAAPHREMTLSSCNRPQGLFSGLCVAVCACSLFPVPPQVTYAQPRLNERVLPPAPRCTSGQLREAAREMQIQRGNPRAPV